MDRPKIEDFFSGETTVEMINNIFLRNKEIYNYIQALDNYIDTIADYAKGIQKAIDTVEGMYCNERDVVGIIKRWEVLTELKKLINT